MSANVMVGGATMSGRLSHVGASEKKHSVVAVLRAVGVGSQSKKASAAMVVPLSRINL
jgi:hypothetical protein